MHPSVTLQTQNNQTSLQTFFWKLDFLVQKLNYFLRRNGQQQSSENFEVSLREDVNKLHKDSKQNL